MCDFVTAALVLTAATTTVGAFSAIQSGKDQEAAFEAASLQQEGQIDDAASQQANEEARRARREAAKLRVAAGGSGLSLNSQSVAAQILDAVKQSKNNQSTLQRNTNNRQAGRVAQSQSLINGVSRPSLLQAGLQIGSATLGTAVATGAIRAKPPATTPAKSSGRGR